VKAILDAFFSARPEVLHWGFTALDKALPNAANLASWVEEGLHANLAYMAANLDKRRDPRALVEWARVAVLFSIRQPRPFGADTGDFKVAAYAQGEDYHRVARRLLNEAEAALVRVATDAGETPPRFQGFCDTWPVFERDLAAESGLGWRGKNACLLHKEHGSGFLLAGFFLDCDPEKLGPAPAPALDFCGGCTACLDACPTDAFIAPGRLDANKCISYWTIEAKGAIPPELSAKFGDRIYGCDTCQDVCPWNLKPRKRAGADETVGPAGWPRSADDWFALLRKAGGFQSRFKDAPLPRAGRRSLMRNLLVVLRNSARPLPPAWRAILEAEEDDPVVREELARTP
jgi:epoxyqueuosine reductase